MGTGSRRWFTYTSDSGDEFGVQLDESTYETAALGFITFLTSAVQTQERYIQASQKRPIEMRYCLLARNDGDERFNRKIYVGANDVGLWVSSKTVVIDGVTWQVTAKVGEKRYLPAPKDTGLNDGDIDDNLAAAPAP